MKAFAIDSTSAYSHGIVIQQVLVGPKTRADFPILAEIK